MFIALLTTSALAAPPDLLQPVHTDAAAPQDAAVVVGLEDYGFLPDVPYAARDAAAVRSLFVDTLGLPADHVLVRTSGNREQLLSAVDDAAAQVGDGGRLWVWFSGHGATSPVDGSLLLVGDDAKPDPAVFSDRSVSVAELAERVEHATVVVADTCAAGKARDGAELLPGTRFAVPSWAAADGGVTLWTAAEPTQLAEPYGPARHGAFTYFAVAALRGWADGSQGEADGAVDLAEAHLFVQRALATVGASQRPTLVGGPGPRLGPVGEAGPALADLPPLRGALVTRPVGVVGAVPPPAAPRFQPPFRHDRGDRFIDSQGQRVMRSQLIEGIDPAAVQRSERAQSRSELAVLGGMGMVGVFGVATTVVAITHGAAQSTYELNAQYCGATTGLESLCDDPPAPLLGKLAPWMALGGAGIAISIGGGLGRKQSQNRLAKAASEPAP